MWMHGPFMGGFSFLMVLPVLFLFALLAALVLRVGRWGFHGGRGRMHGRNMRPSHFISAKDLLDQRYARGEIDDAQYLRMKAALAS